MSQYDRDILKAVKGHSGSNPQNLPGILAVVDAHQRLVLTHEELVSGLGRLVAAGQVVDTGDFTYYVPESPPVVRAFSGVPLEEYKRADEAYRRRFAETLRQLERRVSTPDDKTRQKIVIRWALPGRSYASDRDEDAMEPLIESIQQALDSDGRAEVIGSECGPGRIDVLIFGKETDDDTDDIYTKILPVFRSFSCPRGSCIIRRYSDRAREVVSDVVRGG